MTHRQNWWATGRDRRRIKAETRARNWVRGDYASPAGMLLDASTSVPAYSGNNANEAASTTPIRPYAITDPPFTTDNLGQSFPAGTVWVVLGLSQRRNFGSNMRAAGTNTNPLAFTLTPVSNTVQQDFWYSAYGIPAGATVSITGVGNVSGSTLFGPVSPTINGANLLYEIGRVTLASNDTGVKITSTWTGGTPRLEGFNEGVSGSTESGAIAVPTTLDAAYTLNLDTTNRRMAITRVTSYGDPRRLRGAVNATYESMGISNIGGFAPNPGIVWIGGVPYVNGWSPIAIGRNTFSTAATFIAGVGGGPSSLTTPGFRFAQISFAYTKNTADPLPGDTVSYSVTQDGTTIFTSSATGSAIKTIATSTLTISLPAAGVSTTFLVTISGSAGGAIGAWSVTATVAGSPRCDIPLPFTALGAGNIGAQGGYLPSKLQTPTNSQPLLRLGAGVTSHTFAAPGNAAFLPSADGWYKVTKGGVQQPNIGEYEFGWQDGFNLARGHAGRPFYARNDSGGSNTLAIVAQAPPSPTVIASGGTTLTLVAPGSNGAFRGWASISIPSAGNWRVNLVAQGISRVGMVVDTSFTDATVLTPVETLTWEPWIEALLGTFSGISNTPPVSPASNLTYIVGTNPTGVWAGYANWIAIWNNNVQGWQFSQPRAGSTMTSNPNYWFDGIRWHSNGTDAQLVIPVTTAGAQSVYLCVSVLDAIDGVSGTLSISWGPA